MFVQFVAVVVLAVFTGFANAQDKPVLKTDKDKVSYSIGLDIGTNFKRQSVDLDPKALAAGIADGLSGGKPLLSEDEVRKVLAEFRQQMTTKAQQMAQQAADKNQKDGEAFLAENKKKPGVVTLPSGLQYKVIKEGTGKIPKATDTVETHYRGTLIDGTEFDSSYKRNEPASFPVNGVIKGWTEALQLMKVGSKWQLVVPSTLAYGAQGAGQLIGPNATLIFEVELLSIK
ncbi:MAG: FKBP-type peptidyl-prolyl cis-trans isomerase [Nitrospirae bacterium]|nr:FKBP-type peptidyl-prolyl cis-trans isomerase [Nitrospirota bacterium]